VINTADFQGTITQLSYWKQGKVDAGSGQIVSLCAVVLLG